MKNVLLTIFKERSWDEVDIVGIVVTGGSFPGCEAAGREDDRLPPTRVIPPLHHTPSWHTLSLMKHMDDLTFLCDVNVILCDQRS
jgi:hypothetical protein